MNPQQQQPGQMGGQQGAQQGGQQGGYPEKAFEYVEKKAGINVDQNTNSKLASGAKNAFQKMTGNQPSNPGGN
ncbi:hypothetical protein SPI_02160 [Niveomyces insectorum RCEF 264]|uniref:Uncharacterized protein n=1 Tax=Niveomyces insectorum RCEF 264 TaxID=1081102 RepID=A0A167XTC6_9HYPO|nr:hypothetical protein SPI_02160 [Niveomyces insectorum RCEF 264]